jgi:hypothetical protein
MMIAMLALTGFLVLMAVVIALGTRSTKRYEQSRRGQVSAARPAARAAGGARAT